MLHASLKIRWRVESVITPRLSFIIPVVVTLIVHNNNHITGLYPLISHPITSPSSSLYSSSTSCSPLAPEPPPSKPHFVTRLSPELNVLGGEPVVLRCKVGGYPIPKLSWFKDSEQLPSEPPYQIENREGEGMLRIPESFEDDGGVYSCLASNPSGQDSTSCSVIVTGLHSNINVCFNILEFLFIFVRESRSLTILVTLMILDNRGVTHIHSFFSPCSFLPNIYWYSVVFGVLGIFSGLFVICWCFHDCIPNNKVIAYQEK